MQNRFIGRQSFVLKLAKITDHDDAVEHRLTKERDEANATGNAQRDDAITMETLRADGKWKIKNQYPVVAFRTVQAIRLSFSGRMGADIRLINQH